MSHLKGIAFQSEETQLAKLRERLRKMSDEELIKFGKTVRGLSAPRWRHACAWRIVICLPEKPRSL